MFNFFRRNRPPVDLILSGIKDGNLTVSRDMTTIVTDGTYGLVISRDIQGLPRVHITISQHTYSCWGMETGPSISYQSSEEWMTHAERVKVFTAAAKQFERDAKKLKDVSHEEQRLSLLRDLTARKDVL